MRHLSDHSGNSHRRTVPPAGIYMAAPATVSGGLFGTLILKQDHLLFVSEYTDCNLVLPLPLLTALNLNQVGENVLLLLTMEDHEIRHLFAFMALDCQCCDWKMIEHLKNRP
jgi:hypothetical protein